MRIRFTKPIRLTLVTGYDDISGALETEEEEFEAGEEAECEVEGNNIGDLSIHFFYGIADKVPADCFQILKL